MLEIFLIVENTYGEINIFKDVLEAQFVLEYTMVSNLQQHYLYI